MSETQRPVASGASALVLGGGFAGLSAAIHLALAGLEVTVLEREAALGGKAGEHRAAGFRFDTGPSVFTLPHVLDEVFAAAGRPLPVELVPLDLLCRYRYPSGRVWDVHQDLERTTAGLSSREAEVYRRLLAEARLLFQAAAPTFVYGAVPGPLDLLRYGLRHGWAAHPGMSLSRFVEVRTGGDLPELAQFFLRFATYFGADPYRAPAVLHNIAWVELGLGVSYPRGGIHAVVRALADLAASLGVALKTDHAVERLERAGDRVVAVHTERGVFRADAVVSSLDRVRSHRLLGAPSRLERAEPSLSGFVLLLGVAGEHPELAHHTISFGDDYRAEFRELRAGRLPTSPTLYLNLSCRHDPGDAPEGFENWFVMANAPALASTVDAQRARADEEAYEEQVLDTLVARGLLERSQLCYRHRIGPLRLERFGHRGAIYGRAPNGLFGTLRPPQTVAGIRNLLLAGGTVHPGGGIPLALLSGRRAAKEVLARLGG